MIIKLKDKKICNPVNFAAQEIPGIKITKISNINELCKKPIHELSDLEKAILRA